MTTAPKSGAKTGRGRNRPRLLRKPPSGSDAAAQFGRRLETAFVPEQDLQQQRDVAGFDFSRRRDAKQAVLRQPRDAGRLTEDGREHAAVPATNSVLSRRKLNSASERRRARRIGNQRLAGVEAGGVPEPRQLGDIGARQVLRSIVGGGDRKSDDDDEQHCLQRQNTAAQSASKSRQRQRACPARRLKHIPVAAATFQINDVTFSEWASRIASRPWSTAH